MDNPGQSVATEASQCNGHVSTPPMQGNGRLPRTDHVATVYENTHNSTSTRAAQGADSAAIGAPDQVARQEDSSALQQTCFSEELVGIRVCFQLVDLGRQLYVWAGLEGGAMGCMCLASPPAGADDAVSPSFLRRWPSAYVSQHHDDMAPTQPCGCSGSGIPSISATLLQGDTSHRPLGPQFTQPTRRSRMSSVISTD